MLNGILYGGQIMKEGPNQKGKKEAGWERNLCRISDLHWSRATTWQSGLEAAPVRLYYLHPDLSQLTTCWSMMTIPEEMTTTTAHLHGTTQDQTLSPLPTRASPPALLSIPPPAGPKSSTPEQRTNSVLTLTESSSKEINSTDAPSSPQLNKRTASAELGYNCVFVREIKRAKIG
jgi:hypothetical protein